MAGHLHRYARLALLVLCLAAATEARPASASERSNNGDVRQSWDGYEAEFGTPGRPGRGGGGPGGSSGGSGSPRVPMTAGDGCTYTTRPYSPPDYGVADPDRQALAEHVELYCDGAFVAIVVLGDAAPAPAGGAAVAFDPATTAQHHVDRMAIGDVDLEVRPADRGIVGVPSLLWVDGYDGAPVTATFAAFGMTIEVRATLDHVEWDFGDGATFEGHLGEAFPEGISSVRHAYPRSSGDQPYTVTARLVLAAGWRLDGGPGRPLEPTVRTATTTHAVHQVQAVRQR